MFNRLSRDKCPLGPDRSWDNYRYGDRPQRSGGAGATVTATNTATQVSAKTTATSTGKYTIPLLRAGTYDVSVEQTGFKKYVQTGVLVEVGQTVRVDAALQLGESSQAVEVTAEAVQLERDTSDRGTVISGQAVLDLPLVSQGEQRNPGFFMTLAPGVTGRGTVQPGPSGSGRTLTSTVNGSQSASHEFHLDGAIIGSRVDSQLTLATSLSL
jgi:carboxypeptidase family protein